LKRKKYGCRFTGKKMGDGQMERCGIYGGFTCYYTGLRQIHRCYAQ